jgi:hypothetical protein
MAEVSTNKSPPNVERLVNKVTMQRRVSVVAVVRSATLNDLISKGVHPRSIVCYVSRKSYGILHSIAYYVGIPSPPGVERLMDNGEVTLTL